MFSFVRTTLMLLTSLGCLHAGIADAPADKAQAKVEFRRAEIKPAEGLIEATVEGSKDKIYLHKTAEVTAADVAEARAATDNSGRPAIEVRFTKEGGQKMLKLTEQHRDKPLAILIEGKVISAPIIRDKFGERAVISGKFTEEEVARLVKIINGK